LKFFQSKVLNPSNRPHSPGRFLKSIIEQFFKKGLQTLINAATSFLAKGHQKQEAAPIEKIPFELFWHCNELWISISWPRSTERLCIQRFYDTGYAQGSDSYHFCKTIVDCAKDGMSFPRQIDFDRPSHTINRMKLPKVLKKLYFGRSRKDSFLYRGPKVAVDTATANLLIEQLRESFIFYALGQLKLE
jgi:hypothetical protein